MSRTLPALLLLVLAGAGVGWWLLRDAAPPIDTAPPERPDVERPSEGPLSTLPEVGPDGPVPGSGGATTDGTATHALRPGEPATVSGVVVDEDDRPISGAAVGLFPLDPQVNRGGPLQTEPAQATTETGSDGTFSFEAAHRWWRVEARASGHAPAGVRVAGGGTTVRLVLPAVAYAQVTVLGDDGRPVPEARITARTGGALAEATTDEQGVARLAVAPGAVLLRASAPDGGEAWSGPHGVASGATTAFTLWLEPAVRVSGRVTDAETGAPIEGAEVHAARPGRAFAAEATGPDGRFGPVPAGAPGERALLAAGAPGHAPVLVPVDLPWSDEPVEVDVVLSRAEDWSGHVVDARGEPVAGVGVAFTHDGIDGRSAAATTTDEHGAFTLPPPPPPAPGRQVLLVAEGAGGMAALLTDPL